MQTDDIIKSIAHVELVRVYNYIIYDMLDREEKGFKHYRKMNRKIDSLIASEKNDISDDIDLCFLTALANVVKANGKREGDIAKVICSFDARKKERLLFLYNELVRN